MRSSRRAPPLTRCCGGPDFREPPLTLAGSTRYRTARISPIPANRAIMAKINFVDHTGETRTIDVENGATVMEAAIRNAILGIEAECGGACACATCHVYVRSEEH